MGAADMILFALLALADISLLIHLHRRRQRRVLSQRMMRSLRAAIQREVGTSLVPVRDASGLVLQRAS
jgi:hypothetical protein